MHTAETLIEVIQADGWLLEQGLRGLGQAGLLLWLLLTVLPPLH